MPPLPQVLNSKISCSWGTQLPELKDWDGEQNKALIILGKMISNLLYRLDTHNSMD